MRPDADLSPRGIAGLEAEFLDALDLRQVTLVGNDSGLFLLAAAKHPQRLAGVVVSSCEAFERSTLVLWAAEDGVMAPVHGRRLAGLLTHGQLLEVPDSYTPHPEDQHAELARAASQFVRHHESHQTRHAGPATANVRVAYGKDDLTVEINDDGHGDRVRHRTDGGMGLLGMRNGWSHWAGSSRQVPDRVGGSG